MIPIIFFAPEKYNNEKWPRAVATSPRPGLDFVESESGLILLVDKVIHSTSQIEGRRKVISPLLKVELVEP